MRFGFESQFPNDGGDVAQRGRATSHIRARGKVVGSNPTIIAAGEPLERSFSLT
jgi:hypothetical protein